MIVVRALAVCVLYAAAGMLGRPVWPPSGIALAAVLLFGTRVAPAIFAGALVVQLASAGSIVAALVIASGNTLEALAGAELVRRFARGPRFAERAYDVIKFTVLGAFLAAAVSATLGVGALLMSAHVSARAFGDAWFTWWLADATGVVVVTPVLVLWANRSSVFALRRALEAAALALSLALVALVMFGGGWLDVPVRNYPVSFLVIPSMMWAAFRFGPRVAATAMLGVSIVSVWGTVRDFGPFVLPSDEESLVVLQAFLATVAITTLTVAAAVAEGKRARDDAESANRMKDVFLATVSHELRTPLNAMVGWTSMLRAGALDAAMTAKALETIERNAQLQARMVEDLLDISRILFGNIALAREPVGMSAVVTAALEAARAQAAGKRVRLEAHVAGDVVVSGDPTRLQQIVGNLVANAIKFTPAGAQVTVTLRRSGASAIVEVADTGRGIESSFLPHVFEPFRQGEAGSRRSYGGLGIGLTIVRHLVEAHGGVVRAESRGEGKGATFVVEFPAIGPREITMTKVD